MSSETRSAEVVCHRRSKIYLICTQRHRNMSHVKSACVSVNPYCKTHVLEGFFFCSWLSCFISLCLKVPNLSSLPKKHVWIDASGHSDDEVMRFAQVVSKHSALEAQGRWVSKLQTYFDVYPALLMLLPSVHSSKTGLISLFANTESSGDSRFQ